MKKIRLEAENVIIWETRLQFVSPGHKHVGDIYRKKSNQIKDQLMIEILKRPPRTQTVSHESGFYNRGM